jgi:hypothetical protein
MRVGRSKWNGGSHGGVDSTNEEIAKLGSITATSKFDCGQELIITGTGTIEAALASG